jgi:hypothetical protein
MWLTGSSVGGLLLVVTARLWFCLIWS